ncbi:type IV conjugative transfer system pilin TraA [Ewingella americana]|uniref:type IV conjugative transfer system pilin TraA n=1 Tax=Ewingella americana TaxID=41202 RepID=UPI0012AE4C33|nr:type IV conjugative transfer system pilin TraA [Ewingella americana]MRT06056.1 type IV conjugative transfer system pilin TraA [Ewingella americana]
MTDLCVSKPVVNHSAQKKFSKLSFLKALKFTIPVATVAAFFPETVLAAAATTSKDLMSSGNDTVKGTFGKDSSIVKWVILAEVLVGAVMYMTTKNLKFLAGFAVLSVFISVGMAVAGY